MDDQALVEGSAVFREGEDPAGKRRPRAGVAPMSLWPPTAPGSATPPRGAAPPRPLQAIAPIRPGCIGVPSPLARAHARLPHAPQPGLPKWVGVGGGGSEWEFAPLPLGQARPASLSCHSYREGRKTHSQACGTPFLWSWPVRLNTTALPAVAQSPRQSWPTYHYSCP